MLASRRKRQVTDRMTVMHLLLAALNLGTQKP